MTCKKDSSDSILIVWPEKNGPFLRHDVPSSSCVTGNAQRGISSKIQQKQKKKNAPKSVIKCK